jgi:hypothetical protein
MEGCGEQTCSCALVQAADRPAAVRAAAGSTQLGRQLSARTRVCCSLASTLL